MSKIVWRKKMPKKPTHSNCQGNNDNRGGNADKQSQKNKAVTSACNKKMEQAKTQEHTTPRKAKRLARRSPAGAVSHQPPWISELTGKTRVRWQSSSLAGRKRGLTRIGARPHARRTRVCRQLNDWSTGSCPGICILDLQTFGFDWQTFATFPKSTSIICYTVYLLVWRCLIVF